jgi:hypothetical protein
LPQAPGKLRALGAFFDIPDYPTTGDRTAEIAPE